MHSAIELPVDKFTATLPPPDLLSLGAPVLIANPLADACEWANVEWVRRFHLADEPRVWAKMARTRPAVLAANCYRTAPLDALTLGADLIAWLFLFDDGQGEGVEVSRMAQLFDGYEQVLSNGTLPRDAGPLHVALADLRRRMLAMSGPAWLDRFELSMRQYFDGCLLEVPYRDSGRSPSLRNYRLLRSWSIGTFPVLDLIEPSLGATLPNEVVEQSAWRELRELAVQLCAWTNDIYSYNKECGERDPINLVQVMRHEHDIDAEAGRMAAIRVYQADLARFGVLRARYDAAPGTSAIERAYSRSLEDWIWGNVAWSQATVRYRSAQTVTAGSAWNHVQ